MAPGFFSKLVKPQSGGRHSNDRDNFSRTRSPSPTTPTPTVTSQSGPTHPRQLSISSISPSSIPIIQAPPSPSGASLSSEPSVTIIPPSPRSYTGSFQSSDRESAIAAVPVKEEKERGRGTHNRPPSLSNFDRSSTLGPDTDSGMPTPTPASDKSLSVNGKSRPLTPSSSTGNLRDRVRNVVSRSRSRSRMTQAEPVAPPLPAVPVPPHVAASAVPGPHHVGDTHAQTFPQASGPGAGLTIVPPAPGEPISGASEFRTSPTSTLPTPTPATRSFTVAAGNPNAFPESPAAQFLSPDRVRDSDSVSITSTASGRKRRLWRRSSTISTPQASPKRKTIGLASALVASVSSSGTPSSGSPPRHGSAGSSPPPISPPRRKGSAPKRSPALSGHHAAASMSSVDSNALQLSPPAMGSRRNSFSARPQEHESGYGSSADGHDDDGLDDDDSEDEELLAGLNEGDIPVTGFAVASNKRNADFHELFRAIPEGDYLIEDYGCALQREILVQGRIYISENHICFHANIFGWVTDLIIPIYEIISLEKKMTAFVIPNAIQVTTRTTKYTFASFLARDTAYDVIYNIWRLARPEDGLSEDEHMGRPALDVSPTPDSVSPNGSAAMSLGSVVPPIHKMTFCLCGRENKHYSELAADTVFPGTPERIYNLMFASGFLKDFMRENQKLEDIQISDWAPLPDDNSCLTRNMSYIKPLNGSIGPKSTKCEIRDEMVHCDFDDYVTMMTTTRTPEIPSGGVFSVKTRICITWASSASSRVVVTTQVEWTGRSFIKGIIERGAIEGQRSYQRDLDRAMRIYIQEHQTEFIPEGLDPAAVAVAVGVPGVPAPTGAEFPAAGAQSEEAARKEREKKREQERNQRGLQWAYDTFEGAVAVGRQSAAGAIELIRDAWDQSSTSTILYFVITLLVLSNLWTLMLVGQREESGRRKEMRKTEEREKWVQGIVTALWEELAAGRQAGAALQQQSQPMQPVQQQQQQQQPMPAPSVQLPESWREEVAQLEGALDAVEERVWLIRQSLAELD